MKRNFFLAPIFLLVVGLSVSDASASDDTNGKSFFAHRPQGDNLPRRLVGETPYLYDCELDCFNGVASVALEYTRSFDQKSIGRYFSFNNTNVMRFAGDNAGAADRDVRAEYFGLASDFNGTVEFRPRVENVVIDLNTHFNLDQWLCGLYFEVGLPINWTRFDMNLRENIDNKGTVFDLGLGGANPPAFHNSIIQAYKGKGGTLTLPGPTTITAENLSFARIDGSQTKTSVADLEFVLGYNFWCNDCGHFGINFRVSAPTGTRPDADFVFEPIVGNGKHVQVGGGLSGSYRFWEDDCDRSFSIWFEGEVHHLVENKQRRTFDFTDNGAGSRYLLLRRFNDAGNFDGTVTTAANVTSLKADVSVGAVGEGVVMFTYQQCDFTWDVGYNVWGRSKEKINKLREEIAADTYGIAGDLQAGDPANTTKSNATVSTGGTSDAMSPVFISNDDLDLTSAASPSAVSHKVFTHFQYNWDHCDYQLFAGLGGEVEWSGRRNHALDQWGVWVKGGYAFY